MYSFQIKCSDCNFQLSINDRPLYELNRGSNVNTELPINTFLLSAKNKFCCTITPPQGFNSIPETAKLSLNLLQNTINSNQPSNQIASFETGSYKVDPDNPPKIKDTLSGGINSIVDYKSIFESANDITNSETVKFEIYNKYVTIWKLFKDKKIDDILALFNQKNIETANLTGTKVSEIVEEIKKDYEYYVNDSSLELWEFAPDKVSLKIYGYNKLACLEVANGNQPICFLNRKDRIAIYIPLFFFKNSRTNEFEIIR